jgi:hypothetical protein
MTDDEEKEYDSDDEYSDVEHDGDSENAYV